MKTSYYLVAAAGLTAAVVIAYDRLPLRAQGTDGPMMPLRADVSAPAPLPALPAVPDVPLPPIVTPPDGVLVIPAAGAPASVPPIPVPPVPAAPTLAIPPVAEPVIPVVPPLPAIPPMNTTPVIPPALPAIPPMTPAPVVPPPLSISPATNPVLPIAPSGPAIPPIPSGPLVAPAPAPILPMTPQEPRALPLPAPTPFTPGLDSLNPEPAAKLAATGSFVVVKGNKLIEGTAKIAEDKVIVRQGALNRTYPKADVLYIAESRDDVYRFMLAKVAGNDANARLVVARWCSLNGLREQALTEAREIVKLKPDHRGAADLARSTEESLRLFPADGSAPAKPRGSLVTVVEPDPDVSAEGATTFVSRAQPVLANQCMECHARGDHASGFKLIRVTGFEVGPQATHANLRAVAAQIKKDDPANSPLLAKSLVAHGGMKQPAFVSRQAAGYRLLEAWVAIAIANTTVPPMTPPTQPLIPPTPPVSPIPPAIATTPAAIPTATKPVLPPVEPIAIPASGTQPSASVPPVLPTPASIPQVPMSARTNPAAIPATTGSGQFGTGTKPPVPSTGPEGRDEFDPAGYNRSIPK